MSLAAVIERSEAEREAWKYTSLAALKGVPFERAGVPSLSCEDIAKGQEKVQLVFLNGVWQDKCSYLNGLPPDLIQGNAQAGYVLALAEQMCLIMSPLELFFLSVPGDKPSEAETKLRITLGASSRLTLIERHCRFEKTNSDFAHVMDVSIALDERAKLVHGKIVSGSDLHFSTTSVHAAEGAYYDYFSLVRGGRLTRHDLDVTLTGVMAQCRLYGVSLQRGVRHADVTTRVTHAAPQGSSRQYFKTVLDGKARGVFQGTIVVAEGAQKTDAYQLSRALLLSDEAEMDAKPELRIFADDVKCSHGNTVGDLDEDMLFYLRSRGLDETTARALLIEAFIAELTNEIQAPELREAVNDEVRAWLRA